MKQVKNELSELVKRLSRKKTNMKKQKLHLFLNVKEDGENKNRLSIHIAENAINDKGDGLIMFGNGGLVITDDTEQWNGTKYDIKSMDISGFGGKLTMNHSRSIEDIIGRVIGTRKVGNKRVVIDGIQFAIDQNYKAIYAYNMMKSGYLTDFSIETVGPWPDEDGIYHDSSLVGLSAVVVGNNKSAKINEIAVNSIEQAKKLGLDTSIAEENFICYGESDEHHKQENSNKNKENEMKYKIVKNGRGFAVSVTFKNEAGEDVTVMIPAGQSIQVLANQAEEVEGQITDAEEPKPETPTEPAKPAGGESDNAVLAKLNEIAQKQEALEKQIFDNSTSEPTFKKAKAKSVSNELESTDYRERHGQQILQAWNWLKQGSSEAHKKLMDINAFHLEKLQEKNIVSNAVTLADFGNFVISPELLSDIEGHRSDFSAFLGRLDWRETLSLQMAWLKRSGDINMQEVEMCDDDANGNLKPISDYGATIEQANLHELAAVTPVCTAATRFLAADLLGDVAAGYRTDYDRKRAQLAIVRMQQAVNSTGNTITYGTTSNGSALEAFINTWSQASEEVMNGVFVMSAQTYGELVRRLVGAGISGPLSGVFTTGDQPMILGRPYVIVPNELLPALNTATTRSFTVEGQSVTINQAVFYFDPSTFTGRTSGGLQYDLSTEAAYEENGTVKSAYQRNELVLRGSMFRNGAIKDEDKVVGLGAPGVS